MIDQARIGCILAAALGAPVDDIVAVSPLAGGAVRRHFLIEARVAGEAQHFVLRTHGLTPLGIGLALSQEFTLLRVLAAAGLKVPLPVAASDDPAICGAPFHVTRWCDGSADPAAVVGSPRPELAERLGRELAALQHIVPPMLSMPPAEPALAAIEAARAQLDAVNEARPVAEWAMRRLTARRPEPRAPVFCHGDFRTGNYLVQSGRFVALLDWEFAGWGDPDEDLGWFCSRCWRFGAGHLEAGGIAPRSALYRGYAAVSGRLPEPKRVQFWEAMAALKWLVIALRQRDRYLRLGERSLDLALTGRRAAECEYELLRLLSNSEDNERFT
ncbi:MAG: phosphotransferase family protein [Stellaceae bacterium]